jgi:hypothetical protein
MHADATAVDARADMLSFSEPHGFTDFIADGESDASAYSGASTATYRTTDTQPNC